MNRYAGATIGLCLAGAAASVGLAAATAAAWSPTGSFISQLAILGGPELFLALLAWRRRKHASRSRVLFGVALLVVLGGLAVLSYDYVRFVSESPENRATHSHPLLLLLIQWCVVLAIWLGLVYLEGMEKQRNRRRRKQLDLGSTSRHTGAGKNLFNLNRSTHQGGHHAPATLYRWTVVRRWNRRLGHRPKCIDAGTNRQ